MLCLCRLYSDTDGFPSGLSSSCSTTYVLDEDEPSFLDAIDYSAESNEDEDAEPETEHVTGVHENPELSDSDTNHRD